MKKDLKTLARIRDRREVNLKLAFIHARRYFKVHHTNMGTLIGREILLSSKGNIWLGV